jgi:signal transduction histidine kinase
MAVVILVLVFDLTSTLFGVSQLTDLNQQLQQRDVPLSSDSDAVLVALINEETGLRGYLLTKDPSFEGPLTSGRATYAALVPQLQRLTAGSASLTSDLQTLTSRVDAWQSEYVAPALSAAPVESPTQAALAAKQGKALFDDIRAAQSELRGAITAATDRDFAQAGSTRSRIIAGVIWRDVSGIALGIVLLFFALRAILRPVRRLREVARTMRDGGAVSSTLEPAPPELMEVHEAMVAAGTALQERERALAQANEELKHASQMKSEFLATMSHELRTPLNAILGFTDLVRTGATGEISPQMDDYLERVRRNGSVLLELINDVLDLSKIEAGRMVVNHDVVAVEPAVREVLANVQSIAKAKGLSLRLQPEADNPLALADARAVKQIITNLVGNAVKFTQEGEVSVRIRRTGGATLVDVADTGPGIEPEHQLAIFEPFRQIGAHARTGIGGTGLGLAISVRLARLMGGDITVTSRPGVGSCFSLRLPAVQATAISRPAGAQPVILGVDDDMDALNLLQVQCERMGLDFVGVRQSATAVAAAAALQPTAVLLDIVFPEGSGWEVLDELQHHPQTRAIPVHVISVTDGADRAAAATVAFLQKPVSEERLRAELEPYLRQPMEKSA